IPGADLVASEAALPSLVGDPVRVAVFVEHLQRHESAAGLGHDDGDRAGVEIEHASGLQRVAVRAGRDLRTDVRERAAVGQPPEAAEVDDLRKAPIALRAVEVVRRHQGKRGHETFSMSGNTHSWLKNRGSGPYSRNSTSKSPSSFVGIQLPSAPISGRGPKITSTEPS